MAGRFVVFEGVDGSGKSTQVRRFSAQLEVSGRAAVVTAEPTRGAIGTLIRARLGAGGTGQWQTEIDALLFAADRLAHLDDEVMPALAAGKVVVSDRYDYSSIAYQSGGGTCGPARMTWLKGLNQFARRPDLTVVLDVDASTAHGRRAQRTGTDRMEADVALQAGLIGFYRGLEAHFPEDTIVRVDGRGTEDAVAARVWHAWLGFASKEARE